MKHSTMLTISSLLTILFLIFHMTDDFLREGGLAVRGINNLVVIPVLALFLYGTLVLAGRKSGYIIMLIAGLAGVRGDYLFVWTLLALGVTGLFSLILSVRCLRNPQWGQSRAAE